jgi:hypothetical protein
LLHLVDVYIIDTIFFLSIIVSVAVVSAKWLRLARSMGSNMVSASSLKKKAQSASETQNWIFFNICYLMDKF